MYSDRKHRVTFRVAPELATSLRKLTNQTAFVEDAIREALAKRCPLCQGKGRVHASTLRVPNFRRSRLPRLSGSAGRRLQEIVRLGRRVAATELALRHHRRRGWTFQLARKSEVLLAGTIADKQPGITLGRQD
jgi:hypothetical protein